MSLDQYIRVIDREAKAEAGDADCLFSDYLPRKGVALLFGRSGVGKSFWALLLATCLATGRHAAIPPRVAGNEHHEFAKPAKLGATIYIAGEGAEGLPHRIKACEQALRAEASSGPGVDEGVVLPILPIGIAQLRLNAAEQVFGIWQKANEQIQRGATHGLPVRLIVIDTLIACFNVRDENSNSEMQGVISALRRYAERFDCLVLAIAHPGKGRGARRQGVRGASALANGADVIFSLERSRNARRRITVVKMRDSATERQTFDFELVSIAASAVMRPVAGDVVREGVAPEDKSSLSELSMELLSVIERACESSSVTLENFLGQKVKAANLAQIERAWVAINSERARTEDAEPTKANTLRKRAERGLPTLIEAALIEKTTRESSTYYLPTLAWDH
ncbi:AAA family ATPase [Mesorhizobium sp. B2-4-14]|uniref:AAA family ATPase n=1 Tax=Mesorhizobium sp. B2-4-14 TaxID=2589935 RepID=UPI001126B314|nr:AAA family ATPase [Mesorhizobium sp. B2-4-14]TPL00490.1 AAA family ATPase [Mesorhizobium sp. B2-4-14]